MIFLITKKVDSQLNSNPFIITEAIKQSLSSIFKSLLPAYSLSSNLGKLIDNFLLSHNISLLKQQMVHTTFKSSPYDLFCILLLEAGEQSFA